ncbi:MAG: hypothetical protein ACRECY_20025, partial [Phyllobacterium sp.]
AKATPQDDPQFHNSLADPSFFQVPCEINCKPEPRHVENDGGRFVSDERKSNGPYRKSWTNNVEKQYVNPILPRWCDFRCFGGRSLWIDAPTRADHSMA